MQTKGKNSREVVMEVMRKGDENKDKILARKMDTETANSENCVCLEIKEFPFSSSSSLPKSMYSEGR